MAARFIQEKERGHYSEKNSHYNSEGDFFSVKLSISNYDSLSQNWSIPAEKPRITIDICWPKHLQSSDFEDNFPLGNSSSW